MTTTTVATSQDIAAMLRRHYLPDESRPAGIFLTEIPAPGGARRADVIWQGVTASAGHQLVGHEIKVSRGDVLVELADPTKCDAWLRYCDRWWLVVAHPSLVEGLDLPAPWGVLAPPSGRRRRTCTVVRPAPTLQPAEQGPALREIATRQHWDAHTQRGVLAHAQRDDAQLRNRVRQLDRLVPADAGSFTAERRAAMIARIVDELGGPWSDDQVGTVDSRVPVEDVVAALRDLGAVQERERQTRDSLSWARRDLTRLATNLTRALVGDPDGGDQL